MDFYRLSDIDFSKQVSSDEHYISRSWSQELIYFLLVDRFHDGKSTDRNDSVIDPIDRQEVLMNRHGGTFKGIQSKLSYIKNLGFTTIWLSPVFENYEKDYHGYAINNFLNTDPRFGTIAELKELVREAHALELRVVFDIVINHTADTWYYEKDNPFYTGASYPFGGWKDEHYPIPRELRNVDYYKKAGAIRHWDSYPETQEGDIFELKKLITDESPIGKEVLDILVNIYCYWIKETGVDGFRLDTVKHLKPSAVAIFCSRIREYGRYLGKDNFLIFGEAIGDYDVAGNYLKTIKTQEGYYKGLDAALDFPLHFILEDVVKGKRKITDLYKLYKRNTRALAKLNKDTTSMIVFLDNHDQIGQGHKSRISFEAEPQQVVAMVGLLFFLYGIPCLYYGTEQNLQGNGPHDCWLREPMFRSHENISLFNEESFLYKEIACLAALRKQLSIFTEAKVEWDAISINRGPFYTCEDNNKVIYWSKRIFNEKLILIFNPLKAEKLSICAKLSINSPRIKSKFEYVYGGIGTVEVEAKEGCGYINIDLNPLQFVILK